MNIKKSIINASGAGLFNSDVLSLQELQPMLGLLFDASEDKVVVTDCLNHIVYLNDMQLQFLGLTAEYVLGKNFSEVFAEDASMQRHGEMVQKVIASKKSWTSTRLISVAKGLYDVATVSPILNAERSVLGALSVVKQTTIEKPLAEQEIRRRGVYQKAMMDSFPFMIWLKDKDSRLLAANIAYAEMAGVSDPKALEGKNDFDVWPKHLAETYVEDDLKVLSSGESIMLAERVQKKMVGCLGLKPTRPQWSLMGKWLAR